MRRGGARWILTALAGLLAAPARAETPTQTLIWYRSAEGCPDGEGFLARLEARGVHGRLAQVGDPIDFVVTLGNDAQGARGMLERQTKTGTVAIRKVDGGTCDEVADGVALSLSLADVPAEHREAAAPVPPSAPPEEPRSAAVALDAGPNAPPAASARGSRSARWAFGFQGSVTSGMSPGLLPGGELFVAYAPGRAGLLVGSSLRLSGFGGARGSAISDAGHDYTLSVIGGRLGACPARLGSPGVHVSPCAAFEMGATGAGSSSAVWAAVRAGFRLELRLGEAARLEAEVDAVRPFTRYEIVAESPERTLYRTAPVGLGLGLGANFSWP